MKRSILLVSLLVAGACGGKSPPATTASTTEPAHPGHGDGKPEHAFPAEVGAFHDKLSPLWHAEAGAARTEATCGASGELDQLAEDVQNAAPPAAVDGATWSEHVAQLRGALSRLADDCAATQGASIDANFEAVHDAFHALIDLLPKDELH